VFVRSDALGFGVLRILGDQINPASLLSLSKKLDTDQVENQLKNSVGVLNDFIEAK
jgi:hypothetical protein